MKQLLFTVTNDLNYDQRMIRICTTLSQNGYKVLLIGRRKKDSLPLATQSFAQKRLYCFFQKGKWFYLEYNIRLFFYLLFHRFDAICGIDLDTLLPAFLVAKLKRKICIYDAHEYFTELPEVIHRPMVKWIWSGVARLCIPRVNGAYTVCQSLAGIFEQKYGMPFKVIRNVPFEEKREEGSEVEKKKEYLSNNGEKILLYQGALNDGRGLPELIDAMQEIEGAVLWLAGEGDLSTELRAQVKAMKLEKKVCFLGYVRPHELKEVTRKADVGLNLLENKGLNYYYSLANKAFDYIQAEKPAIHMDFPEYQMLNSQYKTSILLPDLKPENITVAIKCLIKDKATYDLLKENTRQAKTVFNWTKESKILIHFYHKIFTT